MMFNNQQFTSNYKTPRQNSITMNQKRTWSRQEDQILKFLKNKSKIEKWTDIAQIMENQYGIIGRNGKQCRQRYHNHLCSKISKQAWSEDQLKNLIRFHKIHGNRWASIARQMPNRTDNCVKNHFYSRLRKGLKTINKLIKKNLKRYRTFKADIVFRIASQQISNLNGEEQLQFRDIINILLDYSLQENMQLKSENQKKKQIPEIYRLISSVLKGFPEDTKAQENKQSFLQKHERALLLSTQNNNECPQEAVQAQNLYQMTLSLHQEEKHPEQNLEMRQYSQQDYQPLQVYHSLFEPLISQNSSYDHIYM